MNKHALTLGAALALGGCASTAMEAGTQTTYVDQERKAENEVFLGLGGRGFRGPQKNGSVIQCHTSLTADTALKIAETLAIRAILNREQTPCLNGEDVRTAELAGNLSGKRVTMINGHVEVVTEGMDVTSMSKEVGLATAACVKVTPPTEVECSKK